MEELKGHKKRPDGDVNGWTTWPSNGFFVISSRCPVRHPHCWQVGSDQFTETGWQTLVYRHQIADTQVPWHVTEEERLWEMAQFLEWKPQVVRHLRQEVKDHDHTDWPDWEVERESGHLVRWETGTREEGRVLEWAKRADIVRDWSGSSYDRL